MLLFSLYNQFPFNSPDRSGNVSRTHTFTVTNGQRIMVKVSNTMGEHHLEFADFTYTVE